MVLFTTSILLIMVVFLYLNKRKITLGIWSISTFTSSTFITKFPEKEKLVSPCLMAKDVNDVPAEFIADPFI
ncbi:hypothetical protein V7112_23770, partial [Bacillus sp. JJ1566]|uniref:hypothetical protein n=1 Tax=Bacillus sp. JJ1566 TaxID=3122961 RepID=UPI002FFFC1FC